MLYKNLPRNVGLRRLTLHKSATGPNVNYILLVECSHFLDNINQVNSLPTPAATNLQRQHTIINWNNIFISSSSSAQ